MSAACGMHLHIRANSNSDPFPTRRSRNEMEWRVGAGERGDGENSIGGEAEETNGAKDPGKELLTEERRGLTAGAS